MTIPILRSSAFLTFTLAITTLPCEAQRRPTPRSDAPATAGDTALRADAPATAGDAALRGSASQPAQATVAGAARNRNLSTVTVNLPRVLVDSIRDLIAAAAPQERRSMGNMLRTSLRKTAVGDKAEIEAMKAALSHVVQAAVPDPRQTIIVVIGSPDDFTKVGESLTGVQRKVTLAFVDRDLTDDQWDNTVMRAGLTGRAVESATNMWVFLARNRRTVRDRPDHTLMIRAASATTWNGLFAADGDAIDVQQLRSAIASMGSAGAPTGSASARIQSAPFAGFGEGDVVMPKIAGMQLYADPSPTSKVVGTASKLDEFVIDAAAPVNDMVKVVGNITGWVNASLLKKP